MRDRSSENRRFAVVQEPPTSASPVYGVALELAAIPGDFQLKTW